MIYLDHAALTPIVPAARDAMAEAASNSWGNPSSVHGAGRRALAVMEQARIEVASYLACAPPELRWTASGSEALRLALQFCLDVTEGPVVSSRIEHPSLREPVEAAEAAGREVRWLPLASGGLQMCGAETLLQRAEVVALSALNHELGTAFPLAELMERASRAWWVIDAVQAAAWLDLRALYRPRTFLAFAGQKLGGPPGVGALRVPHELAFDRGSRDAPDAFAMPAGTPPWLAAVGMGAACRERQQRLAQQLPRLRRLAQQLLDGMRCSSSAMVHNGDASWIGPILNVSVPNIEAAPLEAALDQRGVCIARTSACQQSRVLASPVVAAAWPDEPWRAQSATRWSLGFDTCERDIGEAIACFADGVAAIGAARARDPVTDEGAPPKGLGPE